MSRLRKSLPLIHAVQHDVQGAIVRQIAVVVGYSPVQAVGARIYNDVDTLLAESIYYDPPEVVERQMVYRRRRFNPFRATRAAFAKWPARIGVVFLREARVTYAHVELTGQRAASLFLTLTRGGSDGVLPAAVLFCPSPAIITASLVLQQRTAGVVLPVFRGTSQVPRD